jgi:hypothetical protein
MSPPEVIIIDSSDSDDGPTERKVIDVDSDSDGQPVSFQITLLVK